MQRFAVSVLTLFIGFPAFAAARLPVVNVSAGAVSARAAFGDVADASKTAPTVTVASAPAAPQADAKSKKVVARAAAPRTAPVARPASPKDAGDDIVARADVLTPRRPSSDLWAKNDAPLRMPLPQEFSVLSSDAALPEESLDAAPRAVAARSATPQPAPMAEMDAQIAKLAELQRRADESVDAPRVAARRTTSVPQTPPAAPRDVAAPRTASNDVTPKADVSLRRMVVPMEDDVIVRAVEKNTSPKIVAARDDMTKLTPSELRKAFRKTYLSENKHLSTFQIDDRFDVASDMSASMEGFTAKRDLSEAGGVRPLEIKVKFRGDDAALSRANYTLLTEYAGIVVSNPKRAIQVSIPASVTQSADARKLAARRLAIIEQVLRDTGVSEQRIMPVLAQRGDDSMVLRIISSDQYETLTQQKRDIFGDTVNKKTYKSMSW